MTKLHWVNSIKIKINYDSNWGGLFVVKLGSIWTDLGEKVAQESGQPVLDNVSGQQAVSPVLWGVIGGNAATDSTLNADS